VRWKTVRHCTRGWISGTAWIAEAPVPITATRRSVRSWSWFQSAVWKVVPANVSSPGSAGIDGSLSGPGAATTTSAVNSPRSVVTRQRSCPSSQVARVTAQSVWMCARSPYSSVTRRR
jgi:hypothetical protein